MLEFIENIVSRMFLAIMPSILWTFMSLLIIYGLYHLRGKDIPNQYTEMFTYILLTNYIMITLFLIFFMKDSLSLF